MESAKKNKLFIDNEAFITLSMMVEGLLYPVTHLMNSKENDEVNKTKTFNGMTFPFSFVLAPAGKKNEEILKSTKPNDTIELYCKNKKVGSIKVEEVFKINRHKRVKLIYGSDDLNNKNIIVIYEK